MRNKKEFRTGTHDGQLLLNKRRKPKENAPDVIVKCCGNCEHSYGNCSAVGIRLGCWKGHVDWFCLPVDFICKGVDWKKKVR